MYAPWHVTAALNSTSDTSFLSVLPHLLQFTQQHASARDPPVCAGDLQCRRKPRDWNHCEQQGASVRWVLYSKRCFQIHERVTVYCRVALFQENMQVLTGSRGFWETSPSLLWMAEFASGVLVVYTTPLQSRCTAYLVNVFVWLFHFSNDLCSPHVPPAPE